MEPTHVRRARCKVTKLTEEQIEVNNARSTASIKVTQISLFLRTHRMRNSTNHTGLGGTPFLEAVLRKIKSALRKNSAHYQSLLKIKGKSTEAGLINCQLRHWYLS
jgi:hypothetical protein